MHASVQIRIKRQRTLPLTSEVVDWDASAWGEAPFADLCGAPSIPASTGKTNRHRLNQGGDRIAINAPWRIIVERLATESRPRTRRSVGPWRDARSEISPVLEGLRSSGEVYRALLEPAARAMASWMAITGAAADIGIYSHLCG